MGITNTIPPSRLIQPGVIDNTAARPASPYEGQAVYQKDTDEFLLYNGSVWYPAWNTAWGVVNTTSGGTNNKGYKNNFPNSSTTAGTTIDISNSSMTFTGVSGRLYRCSAHGQADSTSASGMASFFITDASNNVKQRVYINITNSAGSSHFAISYVFTASTATTLKLRLTATTGTCGVFAADSNGSMVIEDIGPA